MKSRENELLLTYLFLDICILNIALVLTGWLSQVIFAWDYHDMAIYFLHANLACILSYIFFPKKNLFLRDGFNNRFQRITQRTFVFIIISGLIELMIMPVSYLKLFFFTYTLLFYLGKLMFYWLLYRYLFISRLAGHHTNRSLIVETNDTCLYLRKLIDSNPLLGYKFVGYVASQATDDPEVFGSPKDLSEVIDAQNIQMVFVSLSLFGDSQRGKEYLRICNKKGIRMRLIPENQLWYKSHTNLETVGSMSLINPQRIPLDDMDSRLIKRLFDILFSGLVILFIFSWLFPLLAIAIKLSSKGPVFFRQKRTGINNKTFYCLKFRSMQVNDQADSQQACTNDLRITSIGNFLRCSNIDELPQFFNVLLGDMSVVGPRPHMLKHTTQYTELIDYYMIRQYIKPGITGWAQVNGCRGETSRLKQMEDRVDFDIEYLENWTFWWDIRIIYRTMTNKKAFNNAG